MALSRILRKLHILKPLPVKPPINVNKDSKAVTNFLRNINYDQERLLRSLRKFLELRLEYHALQDEEAKTKNLRHQINIFDEIIQAYSFFQEDADINGQRIKNIAKTLNNMAAKSKEPDLIKKTSKLRWKFDW